MQTILITGATGHQGGAVARRLLKTGTFAVRALVRDRASEAARTLTEAGAELVEGDLDNPDSLAAAVQGANGVFSIQISENGAAVEIRQGTALADAAKAAGVSHFVYSSVGSADRDTGVPHFDSKYEIEKHIRALGIPFTILRPVFFLYNYEMVRSFIAGGTLAYPLSPETQLQQLSEDDYAAIVTTVFQRPGEYRGRAIDVASLSTTLPEVAAVFSRILGRPVTYQQVPFEMFEQQLGPELTTMFRWLERVGYDANIAELEREFFPLTDLETYLRSHGWMASTES